MIPTFLGLMIFKMLNCACSASALRGRRLSALDHIELTCHDVTVFAIRDFKTLEVLKKIVFMIILLYVNPNTSHNQILILTIKKKLRKKNFDLKSIK